ncbi:hypothetical protein EON79_03875 [bacterium]|nr:MAG: hypothetical protein EON79_03875 [bacterium]
MGLALITALVFGQTVYAPPDVPRDHWAFRAVNEMFREGLLAGYPAAPWPDLKLPADTEYDAVWLQRTIKARYSVGMGDDPSSNPAHRSKIQPNRYEMALAVHSAFEGVSRVVTDGRFNHRQNREFIAPFLNDIVRGMAMLKPELAELGVDVEKSFAAFNAKWKSRGGPFNAPS